VAKVRVGVTLKMYDYQTLAPKSLAEIASQAKLAEEIGFDSVWVRDHVLIQRGDRRVLAHDPILCLTAIAMATKRVALGSLVLCHAFRHPGQLAREASALADASGGRFILGLGAGWHRPEFDALGLPFDHRTGRLEEAAEPIRRLLKGERVSLDGEWLRLSDASIAVTSAPPPLWIAAAGPRMLALAAMADGWNHSHWGSADTSPFKAALAGLHEALARTNRDPHSLETSVPIACLLSPRSSVQSAFTESEVEVGPPDRLAEVVNDYAEAGAGHVILSLSPDPFGEFDPAQLETAGRILEQL
jgi:alkanesulfonate monooxygenase SsuD/methylene tetrahydromethanopterin reductase-like flavin-dependent oxidoreductase (luciferase family)